MKTYLLIAAVAILSVTHMASANTAVQITNYTNECNWCLKSNITNVYCMDTGKCYTAKPVTVPATACA